MPKTIFRSQGGNGVVMHDAVLLPGQPDGGRLIDDGGYSMLGA